MKYEKPWLPYEEQLKLLKERGLIFEEPMLLRCLKDVGYYRLSGYWHIFKADPSGVNDSFAPGADFADVWKLYTFDRQLRLLTLDAIERVEVYIRSQLAYGLAKLDGPFGYEDSDTLKNITAAEYASFIEKATKAYATSRTPFIAHFKQTYGDCHRLPPYWMLVNILDFGATVKLYQGAPLQIRKDMAAEVGVPASVFESWLLALNSVRNICAHHDRLWNRRLGIKIKIPKSRKHPEWHSPGEFPNDSLSAVLTVLVFLLKKIAPTSSWQLKVDVLLNGIDDAYHRRMGFYEGWRESPIWKPCE